jgi:signal transduction histidine kinase
MILNPELLLTNCVGAFCAAITLVLGIFVLLRAPKKFPNIIFFILTLSIDTFYASHLLGINAIDAESARRIFMFNMNDMLISCLLTHFIFVALGQRTFRRRAMLILEYCAAAALAGLFVLRPYLFLGIPVSKLYLPFYYVPGRLYWILPIFFLLFGIYNLYDLFKIYFQASDMEKNRTKYFLAGLLYAYIIGSTAFLLVFNVPIDPLYSMLFGLCVIPWVYAFLKYELVNIQVIARGALLYAAGIIFIGLIVVIANSANGFLISTIPSFPFFALPLLSACVVVSLAGFVWSKIKEADSMKYEFITVIAHKFRTPLTYIKWSLEGLASNPNDTAKREEALETIRYASGKLAGLTDLLVGLGKTEAGKYTYLFADTDLIKLIESTAEGQENRLKQKNVKLQYRFPEEPAMVLVDSQRMSFVLQILLENALSYTPAGGQITVSVERAKNNFVLSIADTGIGISKEELPYVFSKFFRGAQAKLADTEGMGIGLFITRDIVKRQQGSISVASEGRDRGAVFTITLPVAKKHGRAK